MSFARRVGWLLALLLAASPAAGQSHQYELGARIKAFEAAWETADVAGRARASKTLPDASTQFLTFRFAEAARTLDRARFHLAEEGEPGTSRQWRDALAFTPEAQLVDGSKKELTVTVEPLYEVKGPRPANLEVRLWFVNDVVVTLRPQKFPATVKVPLPPLGEFAGLDRRLFVSIEAGKERVLRSFTISQAKDLNERLGRIEAVASKWTSLETIEQATVRDRLQLLGGLAKGEHPESDLPAASLLENAEAMTNGKPFFTPEKAGEYWMSVPVGGTKTMPVRVFVPKRLDRSKPTPAVVALHGAGATENAFFEGYGIGRAVKEARDRGWIFVAPRCGLSFLTVPPVPAMLAALRQRYPIDEKRTFILGHSMGAALTMELVQSNSFTAAAMLGGGGRVRKPAAVTMPMFIAAGSRDFALDSAKRTAEALQKGGAKDVTFKEYKGIEHLVIVREAIGDVFKHFDAAAK